MADYIGKKILITGGTGSLGKRLVEYFLEQHPGIEALKVVSRDEYKQFLLRQSYPSHKYPHFQLFLGDVRDAQRMRELCQGVDIIIHAAALKHVHTAEANPMECIKTNLIGTQNIVDAAAKANVSQVILISSDKAAAPHNLYGATKFIADKLVVSAASFYPDIKFSVVRLGNLLGSRGSVFEIFQKQKETGSFSITHPEMTRFLTKTQDAIHWINFAVEHLGRGEILIPKIPAFTVKDLIYAYAENPVIQEIGVRPGEKLHEDLLTETDALTGLDFPEHFLILPDLYQFDRFPNAKRLDMFFRYTSNDNPVKLSVTQLKELISDLDLW